MNTKEQGITQDQTGNRRRATLRAALRLLAAVGLTTLALALLAAGPESQQATLVVTAGQATIDTGRTVIPGINIPATMVLSSGEAQTVRRGDVIRMDDSSTGELSLPDGTRIVIDAGTILKVSRLHIASDSTNVTLRLEAGHIYNRVIRLLNRGDSFDIETPSSTASVRGTAFQIQVLDAEASFYAADEGLVGIALGDQKADVPAGYQVLARVGEPLNVVRQGPPMLILTSPAENPERGSMVEVRGQTLPGTSIMVAGTPVAVADDGTFVTQVRASEATIPVEATDPNGLTLLIHITTH